MFARLALLNLLLLSSFPLCSMDGASAQKALEEHKQMEQFTRECMQKACGLLKDELAKPGPVSESLADATKDNAWIFENAPTPEEREFFAAMKAIQEKANQQ